MFSWATKKKSSDGKGIYVVYLCMYTHAFPLHTNLSIYPFIHHTNYVCIYTSSWWIGTDRKSQLAEFKASFPAHRKPNNDDSILEVVFSCQANLAILRLDIYIYMYVYFIGLIILYTWVLSRIYITEEFPVQRPVFQVIGDSKHPWIDSFKRVTGAPSVCIHAFIHIDVCIYQIPLIYKTTR